MECPVCFEDRSLVDCLTCKQGVCYACTLQLDSCPICRTPYPRRWLDYDPLPAYKGLACCIVLLMCFLILLQSHVKIRFH